MENNPERSIEQEICSIHTGFKISELINDIHHFGYEDAVAYSSENLTDLAMIYPESIEVDSFDSVNDAKFIDVGVERYLKLNSPENNDYRDSESEQTIRVSEVSYWSDSGVTYFYIDIHGNVNKVEVEKTADGGNSKQIISKTLESEAIKVVCDLKKVLEKILKNQ